MGRPDAQLSAAKRSYRSAKEVGNRREEARWANVIGDILKNGGEYVEALKWLRIDYEISVKHLPEKDVLPTCQSLGEVYLRLGDFKQALIHQKKHLQLAEDANDTAEEQRACTQLGRSYHEMFLKSEDDHDAIRNAKKYFKMAMRLAQVLKENPPSARSSFLEEYIDAHNNIGMLELDLDNLEAAHEILTKGLEICDEEEVREDDAGRSRLHHNLGNVFMELRKWGKAKEHIEMDIKICQKIGHCQGEAKGYINLGELHYRVHKYEEALSCYSKALSLAKSMEDESALVEQIEQNMNTVDQAKEVMRELEGEELRLKKLSLEMNDAKGTSEERKRMLRVNACLDRLIERASTISAWVKHLEFSKRKKRISIELCDKEKMSDAFLSVGESYQKLRNFKKALKWYTKSWEGYSSISNREGQALAKINMGDALDCMGEFNGSLQAFEEGYRIAVEANLPSVQLSALENMHYSHMIRFQNAELARKLKMKIENLKQPGDDGVMGEEDVCSETDSEGNQQSLLDDRPAAQASDPHRSKPLLSGYDDDDEDEGDDDVPLSSYRKRDRNVGKGEEGRKQRKATSVSEKGSSEQTSGGRKRVRVVLSDDETDSDTATVYEFGFPKDANNVSVSQKVKGMENRSKKLLEESSCSYKPFPNPMEVVSSGNKSTSLNHSANSGNSKGFHRTQHASDLLNLLTFCKADDGKLVFRFENGLSDAVASSCMVSDEDDDDGLSMESLKVELACLYYVKLCDEERSKGLLPIIQDIECDGRRTVRLLDSAGGVVIIEAFIKGWVHKRLMKLYMDCCEELSETPNMKLLKKLYISEVEDEVNGSGCELQDVSAAPLMRSLHVHNSIAVLDLSHNMLGNGTIETMKELFASSSQKYGAFSLNLHDNRFGPTSLFQICECEVLYNRLEVLDISRNRLTDACGSYLSTILTTCKSLYSLNIEHCSLTSRTIQKVADALGSESPLSQLFIGYNNPISSTAIQNLLSKLATLSSVTDLGMNGVKLSSQVVESLSTFAKTPSLSRLLLGSSGISSEEAIRMVESMCSDKEEAVRLDLSYCRLNSSFFRHLNRNTSTPLPSAILELNISGNPVTREGVEDLEAMLRNPRCSLKSLNLSKCELRIHGILRILQALSDNKSLEELNVAENAEADEKLALLHHHQPVKTIEKRKMDGRKRGISEEEEDLEVADSEDEQIESSMCLDIAPEFRLVKDISEALSMANHLRVLDISGNGLRGQAAGTLYESWASGPRRGAGQRHMKDGTLIFYVNAKDWSIKPCCCRKD